MVLFICIPTAALVVLQKPVRFAAQQMQHCKPYGSLYAAFKLHRRHDLVCRNYFGRDSDWLALRDILTVMRIPGNIDTLFSHPKNIPDGI